MRPGALRRYLAIERTPDAIPELDGLRALAIALVLARHSTLAFPSPLRIFPVGAWDAATPLRNGWMGVDLFFVLSGFLITHHLQRRWPERPTAATLGRYLAKRALRIVPAYYAWLLFVVCVPLPYYAFSGHDLAYRLAYHAAFLQDYLPADFVVAFWSLGVEEKFYLLAPLVVVPLLRRTGRSVPLLCLGLLAAAPLAARALVYARGGDWTYATYFWALRSPFHMSCDGLWIGAAAAFVFAGWQRGSPPRAGITWAVAGLALVAPVLVAVPLVDQIGAFDATLLGSVLAAGFGALLLGVLSLRGGGLSRLLSARPLLVVSRLSYSLYLVHMVFLQSVFVALGSLLAWDPWPAGARFAVYATVLVLVSAAAALVLHYAVEKPFLLLKDRF